MACVFCDIIASKQPASIVFEDATSVAFLDFRPLFPGHVLLVPRTHYQTIDELPDEVIGPLFRSVRRLAGAVRMAMAAEGTFVAMNNQVSQSVPHVHVHIVPRKRGDGLKGFFWPRNPYRDAAHMTQTRDAIRAIIE